MMNDKIKIAIFASGNGSNAENIANYFNGNQDVEICRIYSNKVDAYVLKRAKNLKIPSMVFSGKELRETNTVMDQLIADNTDFIVLAGFLLMIPKSMIEVFHNKIINIHPALLPDFGGKGMYGDYVHQAVKNAGENKTGITIHFVNEKYDEGNIIFQSIVPIDENDSVEEIANKVHRLEYEYYPKIIEKLIYE